MVSSGFNPVKVGTRRNNFVQRAKLLRYTVSQSRYLLMHI